MTNVREKGDAFQIKSFLIYKIKKKKNKNT